MIRGAVAGSFGQEGLGRGHGAMSPALVMVPIILLVMVMGTVVNGGGKWGSP